MDNNKGKRILKDNLGFSLVELIVVVLIMAIIAVALAPQILKWVNNSRISTDMQTKDSLAGLMSVTVLTNEAVNAVAKNQGAVLTVDGNGGTLEPKVPNDETAFEDLKKKFFEYAGTDNLSDFKTKTSGGMITITVSEDAATITSVFTVNGNTIENVED